MFDDDNEFRKISRECSGLCLNQRYDDAQLKIEDFLDKHPFRYVDSNYEYHYLKGVERLIFETLFNPTKEVKLISEDYCRVFNTYSFILYNLGQYSKAKVYLNLSLDLNPLDVSTLWDLARIYDAESNGDGVKKALVDALLIVHDIYDLFSTYEYLAIYYRQIGENKISNLLSDLKDEESFGKIDKKEMKRLFNKYGLPLGFNSKIISAMEYAYHQANTRLSFEESYDIYYDYYELCEFNEKYFK